MNPRLKRERHDFAKKLSWEQTNLNNWSKIWISSGIYFKPVLNPPQNLPAPCSCQRLPWFFQCFFIFLDWLISCIEQSLSRLHALLDWWPEQQSVSWRQWSRNLKPKHIERTSFKEGHLAAFGKLTRVNHQQLAFGQRGIPDTSRSVQIHIWIFPRSNWRFPLPREDTILKRELYMDVASMANWDCHGHCCYFEEERPLHLDSIAVSLFTLYI